LIARERRQRGEILGVEERDIDMDRRRKEEDEELEKDREGEEIGRE